MIRLDRDNVSDHTLQANDPRTANSIHLAEPSSTTQTHATSIDVISKSACNDTIVVSMVDIHMGVHIDVVWNLPTRSKQGNGVAQPSCVKLDRLSVRTKSHECHDERQDETCKIATLSSMERVMVYAHECVSDDSTIFHCNRTVCAVCEVPVQTELFELGSTCQLKWKWLADQHVVPEQPTDRIAMLIDRL
ncbi:MAG: hypothetical protein EBT21_03735 [Actinobacteria bacterium]|nr:hypothetical protein [Actinomycetota bacterium]NBY12727.1 hypothetical protein [Actinomycetota bacterium]